MDKPSGNHGTNAHISCLQHGSLGHDSHTGWAIHHPLGKLDAAHPPCIPICEA